MRRWAHRSRLPNVSAHFSAAGVRHAVLDLLGPYEQRTAQIERFAAEVMPLLKDLTEA